MDLQALSDRAEITDALTRYAKGVDSKDWALWRTVFTEDAHVDYSSAGGEVGDRDHVAGWLERSLAPFPWTQHYITNIDIRLDGDTAEVDAMFYNPMQMPGVDGPSSCGGYYHHTFVRTPDGWRSKRLVEENLWFVNPFPAPASA